ncbi:hypothetical protein JCM18918_2959 [Cutibacterium acnes JCM 18918]|nr:hypothetical protein JCM18918_2959 [Cutibacterium acnes JCM 18918]
MVDRRDPELHRAISWASMAGTLLSEVTGLARLSGVAQKTDQKARCVPCCW